MSSAGKWLTAAIDNRPWWVIIAVAALGAIGSEGIKSVPTAYGFVRNFFPTETTIVVSVKHKDTEKPIVGAAVSVINTQTNKKIPISGADTDFISTMNIGISTLNLSIKYGFNYAVYIEIINDEKKYIYTNPVLIKGDMQISAAFDPDKWLLSDDIITKPMGLSVDTANGSLPPWMKIAYGEIGEKEVNGPTSNPRIIEYLRAGGSNATDDVTYWNSAFVNWVMKEYGDSGTNNLSARSWLKWGKETNPLSLGCIAVFWQTSLSSFTGHVGFYVGETSDSILLLGGNQNNSVSITSIAKSRLLGCRIPS